MIRVLLSLLALLAGLGVDTAPASARICGGCDTEIGAVAASGAVVGVAQRAAVCPSAVAVHRLSVAAPTFAIAPAPLARSVLIGIDRARE